MGAPLDGLAGPRSEGETSRAVLQRRNIPGKRRTSGSARSRALGKGKVTVSPVGGLEARVLWLLCLEHGLEDVEGFREEQGADCSCDR